MSHLFPSSRSNKRRRQGYNRQRAEVGHPPRRNRSPIVLLLLILLWSLCLGWGLAQATEGRPTGQPVAQLTTPAQAAPVAQPVVEGTVDRVPAQYKLGQDLYLENCASCHVGLPPALLPTQTWGILLQDPEHYGSTINPPVNPARLIIWQYLKTFSRSLREGEETPYRLRTSRFFKALHPQVKLPRQLTVATCATCHPGASKFNYRQLSPEWE